jgi:diaminopimelate epimerase
MITFAKAHAYGNDFLYVAHPAVIGADLPELARRMCDRNIGVGADGLIVYERTPGGARMRLFNADGGRAEVSGNGVRGLAALLLWEDPHVDRTVTIETEAGTKEAVRLDRNGSRQTFRTAMGLPEGLREVTLDIADGSGAPIRAAIMNLGNPQCIVLGPLPDAGQVRQIGPAIEHHPMFPDRTNVEFALIERPDSVRILIWERGVGLTQSSGTGSCAALVAAAAFGGAARDATVIAPGGAQRVEWREDAVYLTGWAEVLCHGEWLLD